jgi:type II secretory pathway pseudopilin PulG
MPLPIHRRPRRGFTILETMITTMLLAFAAMVFGAASPMTSRVLLRGRNSDLSVDACQKQLELWRNVGYNSLPAIPSGASSLTRSFTPPAELAQGTGTVIFTRVDPTWTETTVDTGRVRVDVIITWGGTALRGGRTVLTSLIRR